jgi:hypothetical protein
MSECQRCHRNTIECSVCKGDGTIWAPWGSGACTECDGTGRVCPVDGRFWQK